MMELLLAISRQLSALGFVCFVNSFALGAVAAAKVASDCDSDGDSHRQPDGDVACEDSRSGSNAGAKGNANGDLRRRFLHVVYL